MPRKGNTKDGGLCIHIYNQEVAGAFRYCAKAKGKVPAHLALELIEKYLKENLIIKNEEDK
jgi:hypothetical protein